MIIAGMAIVLKNFFPHKHKIVLFHQKLGKISCYVSAKHQASLLTHGTLISLHVSMQKNYYQLHDIDIVFSPYESTSYDIYFVHDMLKICLKILPYHVPASELFDLLCNIYKQFDDISPIQKKFYILQIFFAVELFPENEKLYFLVIKQRQLTDQDHKLLQHGLYACWNLYENYTF